MTESENDNMHWRERELCDRSSQKVAGHGPDLGEEGSSEGTADEVLP